MIECPKCNASTSCAELDDGHRIHYCDHCGWGRDRLRTVAAGKPDLHRASYVESPLRAWQLMLLWIVFGLVVFGPYALIMWGVGSVGSITFVDARSREEVAAALNPGYWIGLALYVLTGGFMSPSASSLDDVDYNPFSHTDDMNRIFLWIAILLLPGRLAWMAISGTWRHLRLALVPSRSRP